MYRKIINFFAPKFRAIIFADKCSPKLKLKKIQNLTNTVRKLKNMVKFYSGFKFKLCVKIKLWCKRCEN